MTLAETKLGFRQLGYLLRHFNIVVYVVVGEWAARVQRSAHRLDPEDEQIIARLRQKLDEGMPR